MAEGYIIFWLSPGRVTPHEGDTLVIFISIRKTDIDLAASQHKLRMSESVPTILRLHCLLSGETISRL
jgi:hypothetical protein